MVKPKIDEQLEHQRLTSLINSMVDGVIAVDETVRVVTYNGAALNLLDVNSVKAGEPLEQILKPVDKKNHPIDIKEMVRQALTPTISRDLLLKYADGSLINLYLSIAPVKLGYGQSGQKGYVLLLRDITREKSLEEERDEFISVVSHELRTPIAIAEGNIGNAQFIASKTGDLTAINKALHDAHSQVLFLADLINDLATLSRAERGKLSVSEDNINVAELVTELVNNYQPEASAKGLSLKCEVSPNLEILVSSKLYVREILQNFLTNSLKYTIKGHIVVSAEPAENGVILAVTDTGIGISRSDQSRVFEKFFRSGDYRTRQSSGTGLGLYVTMKLIKLLHASVELKSELDKGSRFSVYIPSLASR